jgi:hypothetical protein
VKISRGFRPQGNRRCFPDYWRTIFSGNLGTYVSRRVRFALRPEQTEEGHMDRVAYSLPDAARIAGVSRTRIFEAVRKQELTIRKAGRASIVTHDDCWRGSTRCL